MKKILFYALLLVSVAAQAQSLSPFKNADGKFGYQNESMTTIIPATYDDAGKFFGNIATVKKGEKWAIINQQGKLLSTFKYASPLDDIFFMNPFSEGMAIVRMQETGGQPLFGYINEAGEETIAPRFADAHNFGDGMAAVKLNNKWGFVNTAGQLVIECRYDDAPIYSLGYGFRNGQSLLLLDGKKLFIDKTGKQVEELFTERLYRLMKDANSHFVMEQGDFIQEDTATKAKFYKSRTTLNADITAITDKGADRLFVCKYDKNKNPLTTDCREQIKEVFALLANKGNSSVIPAGQTYAMAIKTDPDKGLTFYWLVEKKTNRRVAVMIENSQLLELDIFAQQLPERVKS